MFADKNLILLHSFMLIHLRLLCPVTSRLAAHPHLCYNLAAAVASNEWLKQKQFRKRTKVPPSLLCSTDKEEYQQVGVSFVKGFK